MREAAPFLAYGDFTGFAPRDLCTMWPVPPTSTPQSASSPGPGKVVVVSVTHDPATPYQAGVDLARQMGASLITFDGTQHTVVFNGDAVRRHRRGELPGRLGCPAGGSALLIAVVVEDTLGHLCASRRHFGTASQPVLSHPRRPA